MQQAQADKLDHWSFYQARNIRQEVAAGRARPAPGSRPRRPAAAAGRAIDAAIARYEALVADQTQKKEERPRAGRAGPADYDALNYRDDQFDLSDALMAIAISLLAVTALTHKRWLYFAALVPTAIGVVMGLAGLSDGTAPRHDYAVAVVVRLMPDGCRSPADAGRSA